MTDNLPPLPELPPHEVEEWSESYITLRGEGWKKETVEKYAVDYARAALEAGRAAVPAGWVLVPVDPTDKMVQACHHLDLSYMPGQEGADRAAIYRAMLAAAPQPVAQPSEPVVHQYGFARANLYLQTINESLDKQLEEVMAERDARDDVLASIAHLIGAEFTSAYGFSDLVSELEERLSVTQAKPEQAAQPMTDAADAVKRDRERIKAGIMALTMTAESCRGDAGVDTARKALALRIVTLIDGHGDLVLNEAGKKLADQLSGDAG